jgi:hypothetical protein
MGLEHLNLKPITQGSDNMGCWAASMAWWAQSVRKCKYTMDDIKKLYHQWTNQTPGDATKGGLTPTGIKKMLEDQRWHLWYSSIMRGDLDMKYVDSYLSSSPTIVAYLEPAVNGYHMNVLVAKAPFTESHMFVMDPSFDSFQVRNLQYYRQKYSKLVFASSKTLGDSPTYGIQQGY